ncbi:ATP-binding protein [Cohnella pontilimi]|uniref:ATP-binding protein n=1 Tax=Cohnella pontilimi TaxID=2564100 RepID=A0A4U0FHS4_9BACL|nr:AAA family ATPase [Cohnella pontilimi]TJY44511.1 ATP-binding protein [Cohnella pontilimi]
MSKPYLIVVTGRPGSGKTTFAKKLGNEIFMPVLSRDQIKEGYLHTLGKSHNELLEDTNKTATEIFFDTLMGLITNNVSVIAEAAFQHRLWSTMLEPFMGKARIYLLICKVDEKIALDRFVRRGLDNPLREYFHGDKGVDIARKGSELSVPPYEEPRIDVPIFKIDTTEAYTPSIKELCGKIFVE